MKKYTNKVLLLSVLISGIAFAAEYTSLQDKEAAYKYFEAELNFSAGPSAVKDIVDGKLDGVIIDTRLKKDFDNGHIPGAINLPFDKYETFRGDHKTFPGLSKDKINYVYCYELTCNLSKIAAKKFASLGYPVKEVIGGFKSYKERGYTIEN